MDRAITDPNAVIEIIKSTDFRHNSTYRYEIFKEEDKMDWIAHDTVQFPTTTREFHLPVIALTSLPDEILLKVFHYLDATKEDNMKALKAAGLTCRRLLNLVNDRTTLYQLLKSDNVKPSTMFRHTIWTPRTLQRLAKVMAQGRQLADTVWAQWLVTTQSPFLPIRQKCVLRTGINKIIELDGLEDDMPNYRRLWSLNKRDAFYIQAAALLYQEAFFNRHYVYAHGQSSQHVQRRVRAALRYIFICKGPLVALRIFLDPYGSISYTDDLPPFPPCYGARGREIMFLQTTIPTYTDLQATWSLAHALHAEYISQNGPLRYRRDAVVRGKIAYATSRWVLAGQPGDYLIRTARSHRDIKRYEKCLREIQLCLSMWLLGNPLL